MSTLEDPNIEWIHQQLQTAGLMHKAEGNVILGIINAVNKRQFPGFTLEDLDECMGHALSLYKGHPIVDANDERQWAEAIPGELSVKDIVRVKLDAYQGKVGTVHNGRVGRVSAMRNGSIHVVYENADSEMAPGHDISVIEKLV